MFQNKKANVHGLLPEQESLDPCSIKISRRWLDHAILSWSRFMDQTIQGLTVVLCSNKRKFL